MTIPDQIKQPLLRSFHEKTVTPGWNFDGNGPDEKDRQLLVEYDVVVEELNRLDPAYVTLHFANFTACSQRAAFGTSSLTSA
jgi:farnesyl-diphosphate farnesyltransferase